MNEIRVYKMDDYEWWASKWNKEKTYYYYLKQYGLSSEEVCLEDVIECNLNDDGMWWETTDLKDIERLGDADKTFHIKTVKGRKVIEVRYGDLLRKGNEIYKFISFREAIERCGDFTEPFCLAAVDW